MKYKYKKLILAVLLELFLVLYSLLYRFYGENALIGIMSIIPIVLFFFNFQVAIDLFKNKQKRSSIILLMLLLSIVFLGYYISVIPNEAFYYILIGFGFVSIVYNLFELEMTKNIQKIIINDLDTDSVQNDLLVYALTKDESLKEKNNLAKQLFLDVIILGIYVFFFSFTSAFCKKEEIVFKIVDAFIIAIMTGLVIYKCLKYKSWKKYNIIEIISVFLSLFSYFIFEFFVFKVTFSFIAIGISILFLFPYLYSIFWEYKEINRIYE